MHRVEEGLVLGSTPPRLPEVKGPKKKVLYFGGWKVNQIAADYEDMSKSSSQIGKKKVENSSKIHLPFWPPFFWCTTSQFQEASQSCHVPGPVRWRRDPSPRAAGAPGMANMAIFSLGDGSV